MTDFLLRHRDHPNRDRLLREILAGIRSAPNAYAWTANKFIELGRLADAEVIVQDGLGRYGPYVPLLKVQGYLYLARGRPLEAADVLSRAQDAAPKDAEILINLGWAHYRLGDPRAAVNLWERALSIDPRNESLRRDLENARLLSWDRSGGEPHLRRISA